MVPHGRTSCEAQEAQLIARLQDDGTVPLILSERQKWFEDASRFLFQLPEDEHWWCKHSAVASGMAEVLEYSTQRTVQQLWTQMASQLEQCSACVSAYHAAQDAFRVHSDRDWSARVVAAIHLLDCQRLLPLLQRACMLSSTDSIPTDVWTAVYEVLAFPRLMEDEEVLLVAGRGLRNLMALFELDCAGCVFPGVFVLLTHPEADVRHAALAMVRKMPLILALDQLQVLQELLQRICLQLQARAPPSAPAAATEGAAGTARRRFEPLTQHLWLAMKTAVERMNGSMQRRMVGQLPELVPLMLDSAVSAWGVVDAPAYQQVLQLLLMLVDNLQDELWALTPVTPPDLIHSLTAAVRSVLQLSHPPPVAIHKLQFELMRFQLRSSGPYRQEGGFQQLLCSVLFFLLHEVPSAAYPEPSQIAAHLRAFQSVLDAVRLGQPATAALHFFAGPLIRVLAPAAPNPAWALAAAHAGELASVLLRCDALCLYRLCRRDDSGHRSRSQEPECPSPSAGGHADLLLVEIVEPDSDQKTACLHAVLSRQWHDPAFDSLAGLSDQRNSTWFLSPCLWVHLASCASVPVMVGFLAAAAKLGELDCTQLLLAGRLEQQLPPDPTSPDDVAVRGAVSVTAADAGQLLSELLHTAESFQWSCCRRTALLERLLQDEEAECLCAANLVLQTCGRNAGLRRASEALLLASFPGKQQGLHAAVACMLGRPAAATGTIHATLQVLQQVFRSRAAGQGLHWPRLGGMLAWLAVLLSQLNPEAAARPDAGREGAAGAPAGGSERDVRAIAWSTWLLVRDVFTSLAGLADTEDLPDKLQAAEAAVDALPPVLGHVEAHGPGGFGGGDAAAGAADPEEQMREWQNDVLEWMAVLLQVGSRLSRADPGGSGFEAAWGRCLGKLLTPEVVHHLPASVKEAARTIMTSGSGVSNSVRLQLAQLFPQLAPGNLGAQTSPLAELPSSRLHAAAGQDAARTGPAAAPALLDGMGSGTPAERQRNAQQPSMRSGSHAIDLTSDDADEQTLPERLSTALDANSSRGVQQGVCRPSAAASTPQGRGGGGTTDSPILVAEAPVAHASTQTAEAAVQERKEPAAAVAAEVGGASWPRPSLPHAPGAGKRRSPVQGLSPNAGRSSKRPRSVLDMLLASPRRTSPEGTPASNSSQQHRSLFAALSPRRSTPSPPGRRAPASKPAGSSLPNAGSSAAPAAPPPATSSSRAAVVDEGALWKQLTAARKQQQQQQQQQSRRAAGAALQESSTAAAGGDAGGAAAGRRADTAGASHLGVGARTRTKESLPSLPPQDKAPPPPKPASRPLLETDLFDSASQDPAQSHLQAPPPAQTAAPKPPPKQTIMMGTPPGAGPAARRIGAGHGLRRGATDAAAALSLEEVYGEMLSWRLSQILDGSATRAKLGDATVPSKFKSMLDYLSVWRRLLLEEIRAQLASSIQEKSAGSLGVAALRTMSLEEHPSKQFHVVRFQVEAASSDDAWQDGASAARRPAGGDGQRPDVAAGSLLLLTRHPPPSSKVLTVAPSVHALLLVDSTTSSGVGSEVMEAKVRLLEKSSAGLERISKLHALLKRQNSRWHGTVLDSIVPHQRHFVALCAAPRLPERLLQTLLHPTPSQVPPLPTLLSRVGWEPPMAEQLKRSFNPSQLRAVALAAAPSGGPVVLLHGPPGTGKTAAILGCISSLLQRNQPPSAPADDGGQWDYRDRTGRKRKVEEPAEADGDELAGGLQLGYHPPQRVLVCAQSNAALDELVMRIASKGVVTQDGSRRRPAMVRLGKRDQLPQAILQYHIDVLAQEHSDDHAGTRQGSVAAAAAAQKVEALRKEVTQLEERMAAVKASLADGTARARSAPTADGNEDRSRPGSPMRETLAAAGAEAAGAEVQRLQEQLRRRRGDLRAAQQEARRGGREADRARKEVRTAVLKAAEVVLCTLSSAGGDLLARTQGAGMAGAASAAPLPLFTALVVDEAAQAIEPSVLIPLQLVAPTARLVLVGDPKQLPATVLSREAVKRRMALSLFERLEVNGVGKVLLHEQYRMHPDICRFPSLHFYAKKLQNGAGICVETRMAPFHHRPCFRPFLFWNCLASREALSQSSIQNAEEAALVCALLVGLLQKHTAVEVGSIAVLSPYRAQITLLRQRVRSAVHRALAASGASSATTDSLLDIIEFNTIDGYQGREAEVVLFSCVRAQPEKADAARVGFLQDERRMNVAITRARRALWIVGHAPTLMTSHAWRQLLRYSEGKRCLLAASKPYSALLSARSDAMRCGLPAASTGAGAGNTDPAPAAAAGRGDARGKRRRPGSAEPSGRLPQRAGPQEPSEKKAV